MADDRTGDTETKSVSGREITWDERPRTLRELTSVCRLPFPVKFHKGDLSKYLAPSNDNGDILHVQEIRRRKIVLGKRLQWEKRVNDYAVTGEQLEIPASFKGWFEVVPEDGRPVEYFDTIGGITSVKPKRFLVRTSTVGYQLSVEDNVSCWMPCEIKSGEVLTTGMIYMDNKKNKTTKNIFKKLLKSNKNSRKEQDLKYLQCFDGDGKEIMIPLIMSGVFSPVGDAATANYDAVYELQDLIMAFGLPVNAQIIYSGASEKVTCPNGTVRFDDTREEEFALVKKVPDDESGNEAVQGGIPLDSDVKFFREAPVRKKSVKCEAVPKVVVRQPEVEVVPGTNIELPKRVEKDMKKSKTSALLDKLSVRRTKKERAKLKAMKSDDVFSRRLSKNDVSYEEFFNGLNANEEDKENHERNQSQSSGKEENPYKSSKEVKDTYGKIRKPSIQNRDLPPIPKDGGRKSSISDVSKDSIYEHLPPAPKPPARSFTDLTCFPEDDEDDGYMVPMNLRTDFDTVYAEGSDAILRRKPPQVPRDSVRNVRSRRGKGEILCHGVDGHHENCSLDIDDLFSFAYSKDPERPYGTISSRYNVSTSQLYGSNSKGRPPPWRAHIPPAEDHRFLDDQDLDLRHTPAPPARYKSKSQRNLNMDPNATIRSHNLRKMKNVMEVFHFSDSFRDLRDDQPPSPDDSKKRPFEIPYGMSQDPRLIYYHAHPHYTESEPPYRKYHRSVSASGLCESYLKQGDDSAISMGSRGDYGYHNGSDYSYSEYGELEDEDFVPPEKTNQLTVKEVSKCLRYIGMKDRVVLRFSNEQIDGNMLGRLDKKLLKEGFPELNALEIKKILDFIGGWRPKKV